MNLESIKGKILIGFPKKRNYLACFPSEDVERKVKEPTCFSTKNTNKEGITHVLDKFYEKRYGKKRATSQHLFLAKILREE